MYINFSIIFKNGKKESKSYKCTDSLKDIKNKLNTGKFVTINIENDKTLFLNLDDISSLEVAEATWRR